MPASRTSRRHALPSLDPALLVDLERPGQLPVHLGSDRCRPDGCGPAPQVAKTVPKAFDQDAVEKLITALTTDEDDNAHAWRERDLAIVLTHCSPDAACPNWSPSISGNSATSTTRVDSSRLPCTARETSNASSPPSPHSSTRSRPTSTRACSDSPAAARPAPPPTASPWRRQRATDPPSSVPADLVLRLGAASAATLRAVSGMRCDRSVRGSSRS